MQVYFVLFMLKKSINLQVVWVLLILEDKIKKKHKIKFDNNNNNNNEDKNISYIIFALKKIIIIIIIIYYD